MRASVAKQISEDNSTPDIDRVYEIIKLAAHKGDTQISLSTSVTSRSKSQAIIKELLRQGYNATLIDDPRDGAYYSIKW